jgi:hypothetical protein
MPARGEGTGKGGAMNILAISVVVVFVVAVLALAAYALYEMSPFAQHADHYRDPSTGKRLSGTPRLD